MRSEVIMLQSCVAEWIAICMSTLLAFLLVLIDDIFPPAEYRAGIAA